MQSRLRVQGQPIQPMLVTFPLGLFVSATVFDLTDVIGGPRSSGRSATGPASPPSSPPR